MLLCTGGYGNVFYLSTNAKGCNVTAAWRCHKRGAYFANPCYTQIHPTCIPVDGDYQSKLTLMSESLRNDGRVWVPKQAERRARRRSRFPKRNATITWSGGTRRTATWCRATSPAEPPRNAATPDSASATHSWPCTSTSAGPSRNRAKAAIEAKYGNLFHMYQKITDENRIQSPMRIYPAVHYTMGGLWVDYHLESTIPGLFVLGEANFSDHGANRLGASALMQGLADGYFVAPYTVGHHLASRQASRGHDRSPAASDEALSGAAVRIDKLLAIDGNRSVDSFHRALGQIMWEQLRHGPQRDGPRRSAIRRSRALRESSGRTSTSPAAARR